MSSSFLGRPGDDPLNTFGGSSRSAADAVFVSTGAPRAKPKSTKPEAKWEAAEPLEKEAEPRAHTEPRAELSNPRWEKASAFFRDKVKAEVEAWIPELLEHLTKVDFELHHVGAPATDKPLKVVPGHAREGLAQAEFELPRPTDSETRMELDRCEFYFIARHSKSEAIESGTLAASVRDSKPFDGVIFYSPAREEYLVCETEAELKAVLDNARTLDALRDRSLKAWKQADAELRHAALKSVAEDTDKIFGGKTNADSKKAFEELILVQDNKRWGKAVGWSYISADDEEGEIQAGFPKRYPPEKVQERLDKLLGRGNKEERKGQPLKGKVKASLFATEPIAGQVWEWRKPREKDDPPSVFVHTAEAAVGRYLAGWDGGDIAFDRQKKTLEIGVSGKGSVSIFEGRMGLKCEIPGEKGINVLGLLSKVKHKDIFLVDPSRKCLVKVALEGYLSAFVGVSVQGALGLQLTAGPKEEAKAEGSAFAGCQFGAGGKASVLWSRSQDLKFAGLGNIGYDATWQAGVGAKAGLRIGYRDAKFYFEMEAGATLGVGGSGACKWEVDAKEAVQFIGHLCDCVNFHFLTEFVGDAHKAYVNYTYAYHVAQAEHYKRQAEWAKESQADFALWLEKIKPRLAEIKKTLFETSLSHTMLAGVPPEALAQSIRTVMSVREPDDFRIIMNLLKSTVVKRKYDPVRNPTANHKLNGCCGSCRRGRSLETLVRRMIQGSKGGSPSLLRPESSQ